MTETLEQFVERVRIGLIEFEKMWRDGNASDAENWPMEQGPGEWDEQFISGESF